MPFGFRRFNGRSDRFFELLEASAEEGRHSIQSVIRLISQPESMPRLDDFILARRNEKKIAEKISEELVRGHVSELERGEIEEMSRTLYRIPKRAEKFAERFLLSTQTVRNVDFSRHIGLLDKAAETIVAMIQGLRQRHSLARMKELNDRLQYYEGEADKLILDHYRDLYNGSHEALEIFVLKDCFELLEDCIDSCRDAGNAIYHIALNRK
jgi:uncharacterized protein Yka (UPF0111/DUF47 family)